MFHGTDDPVVPIAQSEELVERDPGGGRRRRTTSSTRGRATASATRVNQRDEYDRTERFLDALVPPVAMTDERTVAPLAPFAHRNAVGAGPGDSVPSWHS